MRNWIAVLGCCLLSGVVSAESFMLTSTDITDGQPLSRKQEYMGFGCQGENLSPALSWQHAPTGTKSFAVTVFDPDAPTGSGWWHWLVVNIPVKVMALQQGAGTIKGLLPKGSLQTRTDYGSAGFGGACPPVGDSSHRYQFTVWALNVETLPLNANVSGALVGYMLNQHVLGKASITAHYRR